MNCTSFRKMMYLREDELGPEKWRELQLHRSACAECASEYREVERVMNVLIRFGKIEPIPPEAAEIASGIISKINNQDSAEVSRNARRADAYFVRWLRLPNVRIAMISLLAFLCASFFIEYTSGYVEIEGLENSMTAYSSAQKNFSAPFPTPGDASNVVTSLSNLIAGKKSFFVVSGDWVVINKSSIEQFMVLYNELQEIAPALPPEFRAAHPELWKLLIHRNTPRDLDTLLKERTTLIRELNDLIPQERNRP